MLSERSRLSQFTGLGMEEQGRLLAAASHWVHAGKIDPGGIVSGAQPPTQFDGTVVHASTVGWMEAFAPV